MNRLNTHKPTTNLWSGIGLETEIFLDREYLVNLTDEVRSILEKRNLTTLSGKRVNFCGVIFTEGKLFVFLPRKSVPKDNQDAVPLLLQAVKKYFTRTSSVTADDDGSEMFGVDRLSLISALIEDYCQNGIYSERQSLRTVNSGKPDWATTISRHRPVWSENNLLYLDFETKKHRYKTDSEISRIHAYLTDTLDNKYSKILFGKKRFTDHHIPLPESLEENYLTVRIKQALSKVYSDRDIWLLKSLLELLNQMHGDSRTDEVIGVKNFHFVWEHMLANVLPGELPLNSKFPIPVYITESGHIIECPQKGQRTDIIISDKDRTVLAVIDAKYYDASDSTGAPGWPDLVKQFFYAKAVSSIFPAATVKNFFIFPGVNAPLKSVHMKSRTDASFLDREYGKIECRYESPFEVIKAYVKNQKLHSLGEELLS